MSHQNTRFLALRAWAVHLYTGLGLIVALLALLAVFAGDVGRVIGMLGAALFIDATDGALARAFDVKRWAPGFDGRKLDDITDYINYVFIPAIFAYQFGLVRSGLSGLIVLGIVLLLAAYGFCSTAAKTDDGYFTGFPNFWNVIFFYMYLLRTSPLTNEVILLVFAALVLIPLKYISSCTQPFRRLTTAVMILFWAMLIGMGITAEYIDTRFVWLSLIGPIYYFAMSFYLNWAERRRL